MTKSHPVACAMRKGLSMKAAWSAYRKRKGRVRRRCAYKRNDTGTPFTSTHYRPRLALYGRKTKTVVSKRQLASLMRSNRARRNRRRG